MIRKILPYIGFAYLQMVGKTSKISIVNDIEFEELERTGKNFIYAFWHGRQFFLVYSHRNKNICILISLSRDGEYVAELTKKFGFKYVRGSTSRGGVKALLQMIKNLRNGSLCAFTPDGPKGPARKIQDGVLYAAMKSGRPIVPLTYSARFARKLNSWDGFLVPLPVPGNRIVVMHGKPVYVSRTDNIEMKKPELEDALNRITARADSAAHKSPRDSTGANC